MRAPLVLALALAPAAASANSMVSHVWVAEQAADAQPPGPLRDIVTDPALRPALQNGAIYQDSGYSVRAEYGEWAHWESFLEPYVRYIRGRWGAEGFRSADARRHVAFLMGLAAHSMTDQTFDQYFMERVRQYDRTDANDLDLGADAWLMVEHGVTSSADGRFWFDEMPAIHAAVGGPAVTPELLRRASDLTAGTTQFLARYGWSLYPGHWRMMPWAASHYWDRGTPGSYPHLVETTAAYQAFLWRRLEGTAPDDAGFLYSWPAPGQANFPVAAADIESRIALTTAWGLDDATVSAATVRVRTESGEAVPARVSRYGDHGNTVMVRTTGDLAFNTAYRVELDASVRTLAGRAIGRTLTVAFRTRCAPDRLGECPPLTAPLPTLAEPPVRDPRPPPGMTPPGPVVMVDDAGNPEDAGADATARDAAAIDAGAPAPREEAGCGCRAQETGRGGAWALLALAALARRRRRP
ncbi:MAG: Ig-like domain-containing protein [Polyangiales bacterium]